MDKNRSSSWLLAFVVIVDLVEQAAAIGFERPVMDARRAAGIGRRVEGLTALALLVIADDEVARNQVHLLPVIVHEGRSGVHAGFEAQEPRAASHLAVLVEVAREDLLRDAGGIAGRRGPAALHVHAGKFEMRLVHRNNILDFIEFSLSLRTWLRTL